MLFNYYFMIYLNMLRDDELPEIGIDEKVWKTLETI